MPTETRLDITPAGSPGLLCIQDPSAAQGPQVESSGGQWAPGGRSCEGGSKGCGTHVVLTLTQGLQSDFHGLSGTRQPPWFHSPSYRKPTEGSGDPRVPPG